MTTKKFLYATASLLLLLVLASSRGQSIKPVASVSDIEKKPSAELQIPKGFYRVDRVVDGDTIKVQIEGKEETVRMIGIDTPEVVDPRKPVQCFGREASEEAKNILDGVVVHLEKDPSQGERDKYSRLLAYVFLQDGKNFNKFMIEEGYAHEYTYRFPYKYQKEFKEAERRSRVAQRGLWAPGVCAANINVTSSSK